MKIHSMKIKLVIQNGWGEDAQKVTQSITLAADWQTVTVKFSDALVGGNYEMILQPETFDGIIDLESVAVFKDENLEKEALIGAMQKWINGMMQATRGKVKAWDMINEAIAGDGNVNGYYDLQHAAGGGGTWDVGGQTFYWQDYFGSKECGVIVEKLAREAYANVEGTNPDDLKLLYEASKECGGLAIGSRYCDGVSVINWPIGRIIMSYYASAYVRTVLNMKVYDCTAGFKCYSKALLSTIDLDKVEMKGYGFQIEMKYTSLKLGFKVKEVPIIFINRKAGTSKMSSGIFGEAFWGVLKLRFRKITPKQNS